MWYHRRRTFKRKARSSNIKLNTSKHCFKVQEMLMKYSIKTEQAKLKAIVIGQREIQKIMEMVNYGPKFIPSLVVHINIGGHFSKMYLVLDFYTFRLITYVVGLSSELGDLIANISYPFKSHLQCALV
uniref:Uncharacterized protein n=1 Tax=Micrurus corallinus TaxID=54390 RepID=A0A2D4FGC1_MICCO